MHKLNDEILSMLINDKLNIHETMGNKEQYGYFIFDENIKDKKVYFEGLYSITVKNYKFNTLE